jgi:hypothetical protein
MVHRWAVALAGVLFLGGCDQPTGTSAPREPSAPRLQVTVQQQRPDESTRTVGVEATNQTDAPVHVSAVRLTGGGLAGPTTPLDTELQPGLTVALRTSYGRPDCSDRQSPVVAHLTIGGRVASYPVDAVGRDEVRRLLAYDCPRIALARTADVRLTGPYREVVAGGRPMLRGRLLLTRRAAGAPVNIRSLSGSVLVDLRPVGRLVDLSAQRARAVSPVLLGSNGRCDWHALGGSTQTFLLHAYVRLGDHPEQRVVLTPPRPVQGRVLHLVDRACHG